ncbi:MAG: hypothetical protein KBT01_05080 [Clostridiales bacterium]|nr:hypothetical protein [Candidatus Blautia equi]
MTKLIKYEFKKSMFTKYVLIVATLVAQLVFMFGVLSEKDTSMTWGIVGLVLCAIVGTSFIGIESILTMHQDLNTKQSYMLFLTPRSTYQILGAKVLQNGLSLLIVGAIFGILAIADFSFMVIKLDGLEELLDFAQMMLKQINMEITITRQEVFLGLFGAISSWMNMITNGYLAIVISATFFAGRKFSGLISFLIYIVLVIAEGRILSLLPEMATVDATLALMIGVNVVMIIVIYFVTGWIMEKKLNV